MFPLYTLAVANVFIMAVVQRTQSQSIALGQHPEECFGFHSQRAPNFKEDQKAVLPAYSSLCKSTKGESCKSSVLLKVVCYPYFDVCSCSSISDVKGDSRARVQASSRIEDLS
jgi:hypothetical protein